MPSKATTYTVTVVKAQTQPYSMLLKSWQECILPCPPHTHCVCLFLVIFVTVVVLPHSYLMGFLLYRWQDSICRDSGRLHPLLQPAIERRVSGVPLLQYGSAALVHGFRGHYALCNIC